VVTPSNALQAVACSGLVVLVEINKARSEDETRGVNDARPNKRPLADGGNLVAANTNVANSVKRGLGVEDASAVDHQVITDLGEGRAANNQGKQRNPRCNDKRTKSASRHIAPAIRLVRGGQGQV
jgi:hypothetical protein